MRGTTSMNLIAKTLASPLRAYFNPRFEAMNNRLRRIESEFDPRFESLSTELGGVEAKINALVDEVALQNRQGAELAARVQAEVDASRARTAAVMLQASLLAEVDLSAHNRDARWPSFDRLECQAASAAQCDDPVYREWCGYMGESESLARAGARQYNRKLWEWAFIAEAIRQAGLLREGVHAAGFGVGREPLPALLASYGVEVLATDQSAETGEHWAASGELLGGLSGLSRPEMISDAALAEKVRLREVDMNAVPEDLGRFDITWSSCVIEHLGSPQRGMDFVLEACRMLKPGGIAVHTTEFELTSKPTTMDYGNCAVYRIGDLLDLERRLAAVGCEATFNFAVSMDSAADRWISLLALGLGHALPDEAHLKLALGDSVSTSYGILIRKTAA